MGIGVVIAYLKVVQSKINAQLKDLHRGVSEVGDVVESVKDQTHNDHPTNLWTISTRSAGSLAASASFSPMWLTPSSCRVKRLALTVKCSRSCKPRSSRIAQGASR